MDNCSSRSLDPFYAELWGQGLFLLWSHNYHGAITRMYQLTFRALVVCDVLQGTTAHLQFFVPIFGSMKPIQLSYMSPSP